MLKLFQRSLLNRASQLNPRSAFHTTTATNLKRILVNEDAKTKVIKIDAEYMPESGQSTLKFGNDQKNQNIKPCAFCELEKNDIFVQHTDVLILKQFLKEDGEVLNRKVTGLCKKQQKKLLVIAKQAKQAGLTLNLAKKTLNGQMRLESSGMKFNTYFSDYEQMKRTHKFL